jgi:hypothetical protein
MTRTSPPQVAFSSGELDPLLHRRFDYQRFQTGLRTCKGFLPLPQGGFTRAPGSLYRGGTRGNVQGYVIPFQFAANDCVVLEFTDFAMRVWRYGSLVTSGASPYVLTTPYSLGALSRLKWVQSADVIYLVDGVLPMKRLSRFALNNWTITDVALNTGPFRPENINTSIKLTASDDTGTITLAASTSYFVANMVGGLLQLRPGDQIGVQLWTANEPVATAPVGSRRRYGKNTYELVLTGATVGSNPPVHSSGQARVDNSGPVVWKFLSSDVGIARITAVASGISATATVLQNIPRSCLTDATWRWSEGAWSARYGYPSSIEIFEQRLAAAATPGEPRTVWFSAVGDFADFTPGVEADDSFAYTIAGDSSVNAILNLKRGRTGLHIFALGEEYSSRSDTRNQVIGPTTAVFGQNGSQGASVARPIAIDGNPVFITRDQRRVIQISYSYEQDSNVAQNLSLPAGHLGNAAFQQIVWQVNPQPMAFILRDTGDLAVMIYQPQEEVLGWATLPLAGGVVKSLAITSDATGTSDILTMVVRRMVNGTTQWFVEELALIYGVLTGDEPITDACHLYAALEFSPGVATNTFSLPHLPGTQVYAWTDQGEFGPLTVALDGTVALETAVSHAFIGLFDATHMAETLDIQAAAPDGNTMGRQKRLQSGVGLGLSRTAQGQVQVVERDLGQPERAGPKTPLIAQPVAANLTNGYSGVVKVDVASGHAKELSLRIWPQGGAPLTITAITPTVQEAGR